MVHSVGERKLPLVNFKLMFALFLYQSMLITFWSTERKLKLPFKWWTEKAVIQVTLGQCHRWPFSWSPFTIYDLKEWPLIVIIGQLIQVKFLYQFAIFIIKLLLLFLLSLAVVLCFNLFLTFQACLKHEISFFRVNIFRSWS